MQQKGKLWFKPDDSISSGPFVKEGQVCAVWNRQCAVLSAHRQHGCMRKDTKDFFITGCVKGVA